MKKLLITSFLLPMIAGAAASHKMSLDQMVGMDMPSFPAGVPHKQGRGLTCHGVNGVASAILAIREFYMPGDPDKKTIGTYVGWFKGRRFAFYHNATRIMYLDTNADGKVDEAVIVKRFSPFEQCSAMTAT